MGQVSFGTLEPARERRQSTIIATPAAAPVLSLLGISRFPAPDDPARTERFQYGELPIVELRKDDARYVAMELGIGFSVGYGRDL
jgi:hypothetical protein